MTQEEDTLLEGYILAKFKGAFEFNAWLVVHIWPKWRAKRAKQAKTDTSPVSTRFKALDGTQLTEDQVWKCARSGEHVLDLATGQPRRFLWRVKGKLGRWVPLDNKDAW